MPAKADMSLEPDICSTFPRTLPKAPTVPRKKENRQEMERQGDERQGDERQGNERQGNGEASSLVFLVIASNLRVCTRSARFKKVLLGF